MLWGSELLAIGGVAEHWPGVGNVWMAITPLGQEKPLVLIRQSRKFLAIFHELGKFHRLQMHVSCEIEKHGKFAETLGFTFECRMAQYSVSRQDMNQYSKVLPW